MGILATTMTSKGQVTIPKHIRDAMKLKPGKTLVFDVNKDGEIVLRPSAPIKNRRPDRFDRAIGCADIKWPGGTDEYMKFIRGED
jgi:AbrB family looped-hinge helix DNA binding protein